MSPTRPRRRVRGAAHAASRHAPPGPRRPRACRCCYRYWCTTTLVI